MGASVWAWVVFVPEAAGQELMAKPAGKLPSEVGFLEKSQVWEEVCGVRPGFVLFSHLVWGRSRKSWALPAPGPAHHPGALQTGCEGQRNSPTGSPLSLCQCLL